LRRQGVDFGLDDALLRLVAVGVEIEVLDPAAEAFLVAVGGRDEQLAALIAVLFGRDA
jgi:hypothetical protein